MGFWRAAAPVQPCESTHNKVFTAVPRDNRACTVKLLSVSSCFYPTPMGMNRRENGNSRKRKKYSQSSLKMSGRITGNVAQQGTVHLTYAQKFNPQHQGKEKRTSGSSSSGDEKKSYEGKKSASGCPSLGVGGLSRSGWGKGESKTGWNLLQEPVSGHSHPVDILQDVVPTIHPRGHSSRSSPL